jgi:hypothetical protein
VDCDCKRSRTPLWMCFFVCFSAARARALLSLLGGGLGF